ncbi:MAG: 5-formyltetrahydrofolate cyclo-ligase [Jatrophihabitantaceae bacterium]
MSDKDSLRASVRAARSAMPAEERETARQAIRRAVLRQCRELPLPAGSRIAAYEPLRTEPGSVELLRDLRAAGYQVIVPRTLPDRDLDWLPWTEPAATPAQSLGRDAIGTAALVLVPAFAVDLAGRRLGRGGGSYDRALARVPAGTVTAALIFAGELVERVPTAAWDQPVTAVVNPTGWLDLTRTGRRNT